MSPEVTSDRSAVRRRSEAVLARESKTVGRPRVLLIGLGKAGQRFYKALSYLQRVSGSVELVGVCDMDPTKLDSIVGVTRYTNHEEALHSSAPDVVLVCVNERDHFAVLTAIAAGPTPHPLVLCEKPLTETLEQCLAIEGMLSAHRVTVNFVERYSLVVDDYLEWARSHDVEVIRAEFFWGKYRFRDDRPTMGVLSEISHPVDLLQALVSHCPAPPVEVHDVSLSSSDFSVHPGAVLDSLDAKFKLDGGITVRAHTSFVWECRRRCVILYARGRSSERMYQANLSFDNPRWDQDSLEVFELDRYSGLRTPVLATAYDNADFPPELDGIWKVTRYVAESLQLIHDPEARGNLATLPQAKWVQQLLKDMLFAAGQPHLHYAPFESPGRGRADPRPGLASTRSSR